MECSVLPSTGMHSCRPAYIMLLLLLLYNSALTLPNVAVTARGGQWCVVACDQVCGVHVHDLQRLALSLP